MTLLIECSQYVREFCTVSSETPEPEEEVKGKGKGKLIVADDPSQGGSAGATVSDSSKPRAQAETEAEANVEAPPAKKGKRQKNVTSNGIRVLGDRRTPLGPARHIPHLRS